MRAVSAILVGAVFLLSACSGATSQPAAPQATPDTSNLVVAVNSLGSARWIPWITASGEEDPLYQAVGENLFTVNPATRKIDGRLAESWSVTPDGKTWTIKLRPNIPFHGGYGDMTAEDWKFTWGQYISKESTHTLASQMRGIVDNDMKNFEVVGPLEFRLRMPSPLVYLPSLLSDLPPGPTVQSKKYWETKAAEAPTHPVSTGPFEFVSSTPGVEVKLKAVDKHWRQTATYKTVTIKIIADDSARLAQVRAGSVDLAQVTPRLAGEARAASVKVVSIPDTATGFVVMGGQYDATVDPARAAKYDRAAPWIQADSPAKGLAIRQAMALAIDRKSILDKIINGQGQLTHAPIAQYPNNPAQVDPSWKLTEFSLAQAKLKLAEGGYPNGFPLTFMIYEQVPGQADVGEAVAGMFETLGLKVTRKIYDQFAPARDLIRARDTKGMAYVHFTPFYDEPVQGFSSYLATGATTHFYDPAITAAFPKLNAEPDPVKRAALSREVFSSLIASQRAIPLFTYNQQYVASKKVGSWTPVPGTEDPFNFETIKP